MNVTAFGMSDLQCGHMLVGTFPGQLSRPGCQSWMAAMFSAAEGRCQCSVDGPFPSAANLCCQLLSQGTYGGCMLAHS